MKQTLGAVYNYFVEIFYLTVFNPYVYQLATQLITKHGHRDYSIIFLECNLILELFCQRRHYLYFHEGFETAAVVVVNILISKEIVTVYALQLLS